MGERNEMPDLEVIFEATWGWGWRSGKVLHGPWPSLDAVVASIARELGRPIAEEVAEGLRQRLAAEQALTVAILEDASGGWRWQGEGHDRGPFRTAEALMDDVAAVLGQRAAAIIAQVVLMRTEEEAAAANGSGSSSIHRSALDAAVPTDPHLSTCLSGCLTYVRHGREPVLHAPPAMHMAFSRAV
jgi:hypothetical protein